MIGSKNNDYTSVGDLKENLSRDTCVSPVQRDYYFSKVSYTKLFLGLIESPQNVHQTQ